MYRLDPPVASWVLDLDGVVWLAGRPIPGAPEAVMRLRGSGARVIFATNNSAPPIGELEARLASFGMPAVGDVVTSAQAAASMLEPGMSAMACAGPGVVEALEARGVSVVTDGRPDAVVVGFHTDFDYERLRIAHRAVDGGARLIGANDDPTYPTPAGPIPGGGAILAAVATAAGVAPEIAGKPYAPMADLVRSMLGEGRIGVVGDRASTDGRLARTLQGDFVLVLSGVTGPEDLPTDPMADLVCADLRAVADAATGP
ncbi:MAG: HAD hydrolase-like protein [Acidimicrobiales bacterium]